MSTETFDIHRAIQENVGCLDKVVEILKTKKDASKLAQMTDELGDLPLHSAMRYGTAKIFELVKLLVKLHPKGVNATNDFGQLPIHLVHRIDKYSKQDDIFLAQEFLLQQFPDGSKIQSAADGCLPIHNAAAGCAFKFVGLLLEVYPQGCEVEDCEACLPIHDVGCSCSSELSTKTMQLLVDAYPEGCRARNCYDNLPIHEICLAEDPGQLYDTLNILVKSYPESLTTKNDEGCIPLDIVMEKNMESTDEQAAEFVKLLCTKHPIGHISQVMSTLIKYDNMVGAPAVGTTIHPAALLAIVESRIDWMAKELAEATKRETKLLSHILDPDSEGSIEDLKSLVKSLDARLCSRKKCNDPDWKPSVFQQTLVSIVLNDGAPSQKNLLQTIKALHAELPEVEAAYELAEVEAEFSTENNF